MIADSHAHLDMPQFDADRPEVIQRAREAGVEILSTTGSANPQEPSVEKALALALEHDFIYAAIGVHPHDARLLEEAYWQRMQSWAEHPRAVLWGAIGLGYCCDNCRRAAQ